MLMTIVNIRHVVCHRRDSESWGDLAAAIRQRFRSRSVLRDTHKHDLRNSPLFAIRSSRCLRGRRQSRPHGRYAPNRINLGDRPFHLG